MIIKAEISYPYRNWIIIRDNPDQKEYTAVLPSPNVHALFVYIPSKCKYIDVC